MLILTSLGTRKFKDEEQASLCDVCLFIYECQILTFLKQIFTEYKFLCK